MGVDVKAECALKLEPVRYVQWGAGAGRWWGIGTFRAVGARSLCAWAQMRDHWASRPSIFNLPNPNHINQILGDSAEKIKTTYAFCPRPTYADYPHCSRSSISQVTSGRDAPRQGWRGSCRLHVWPSASRLVVRVCRIIASPVCHRKKREGFARSEFSRACAVLLSMDTQLDPETSRPLAQQGSDHPRSCLPS